MAIQPYIGLISVLLAAAIILAALTLLGVAMLLRAIRKLSWANHSLEQQLKQIRLRQESDREAMLQASGLVLGTVSAAWAKPLPPMREINATVGKDFTISPLTGLTRKSWFHLAETLLENALRYTDGLTQPLRFPDSGAAGYPRLDRTGHLMGRQVAYLESYARTLMLATPLLKANPGLHLHGRSVRDYYLRYLVQGVMKYDTAIFGWEAGEGEEPSQRIVEAAAIALCLCLAEEILWDPLSDAEKRLVAAWLGQFKDRQVYQNNWMWFTVLINTFLKLHGYDHNRDVLSGNLEKIRGLHVDQGWYLDGNKFDFYSAWALQFYPILWAHLDGDAYPALRDDFYRFNDLFLASFPHVFSREGWMPLWGRSASYRFAASSPMAVAFMRPGQPSIDPGFARRICSGNLLQFVQHPDFLRHGLPALGFYGEDPDLVDDYSCVASPFWCAKLFLALLLPEDNPFWTATETNGFWDAPPAKVEFGKTGMWVGHDARTGHSCLHADQSQRTKDRRYAGPTYDTADVEWRFPHLGRVG